jgi:hypothetical protein
MDVVSRRPKPPAGRAKKKKTAAKTKKQRAKERRQMRVQPIPKDMTELKMLVTIPPPSPPRIPKEQRLSNGGEGLRFDLLANAPKASQRRRRARRADRVAAHNGISRESAKVALALHRTNDEHNKPKDSDRFVHSIPRDNPPDRKPGRTDEELRQSQSPPPQAQVNAQEKRTTQKPGRRAAGDSLPHPTVDPPFISRRHQKLSRTMGPALNTANRGGSPEVGHPSQRRTRPRGSGAAVMDAFAAITGERVKDHLPMANAVGNKIAGLPVPHLPTSNEKHPLGIRLSYHLYPPVETPEVPPDAGGRDTLVPDPAGFDILTGEGTIERVEEDGSLLGLADPLGDTSQRARRPQNLHQTDPKIVAAETASLLGCLPSKELRPVVNFGSDAGYDPVMGGTSATALRDAAAVTKLKDDFPRGMQPRLPSSIDLESTEGQKTAYEAAKDWTERVFGGIAWDQTIARITTRTRAAERTRTVPTLSPEEILEVEGVMKGVIDVHNLNEDQRIVMEAVKGLGVTVPEYVRIMQHTASRLTERTRRAIRTGNDCASLVAQAKLVATVRTGVRGPELVKLIARAQEVRKMTHGQILHGAGASNMPPEDYVNSQAGLLKKLAPLFTRSTAVSSLTVAALTPPLRDMDASSAAATYVRLRKDPGVEPIPVPRAYIEKWARTIRIRKHDTPCSAGANCCFMTLYPNTVPNLRRMPGVAFPLPDLAKWQTSDYLKKFSYAQIVSFCRSMCGALIHVAKTTVSDNPAQIHAALLHLSNDTEFNAEMETVDGMGQRIWDIYSLPRELAEVTRDSPLYTYVRRTPTEGEVLSGEVIATEFRANLVGALLQMYGALDKRSREKEHVVVPAMTTEEIAAFVAEVAVVFSPGRIIQFQLDITRIGERLVKAISRLGRAAAVNRDKVVDVATRQFVDSERGRVRSEAVSAAGGNVAASRVRISKDMTEPQRGRIPNVNPHLAHVSEDFRSSRDHWLREVVRVMDSFFVEDCDLSLCNKRTVWKGDPAAEPSTATHGINEDGTHPVPPPRHRKAFVKNPGLADMLLEDIAGQDPGVIAMETVAATVGASLENPTDDYKEETYMDHMPGCSTKKKSPPPPMNGVTCNNLCILCLVSKGAISRMVSAAGGRRKETSLPSSPIYVMIGPGEFSVTSLTCPDNSFGGDTHPLLMYNRHFFDLTRNEDEDCWTAELLYPEVNTLEQAYDANF